MSSLPNHSDWTESGNLALMFGFAVVGVGVGSDSGMFVEDSSFFPNTMDLEITHSWRHIYKSAIVLLIKKQPSVPYFL